MKRKIWISPDTLYNLSTVIKLFYNSVQSFPKLGNPAGVIRFVQKQSGSVLLLDTDIWTWLAIRLHIRKNGFIHNDADRAQSEILFKNHKVNK